MIVTYNWLKEFVDLDLPAEEIAHLLTMLGLEVERIDKVGEGMDEVVVAVVEEKTQHPNADTLFLCKVNNGKEILSIVCGAQNFKIGDKVALAQASAVLPGGLKIKKSKIRGEESFGMLCSERELGFADESAGIMILTADKQLGAPIQDALGLKDTIFEIGLTPNRADCLSVIGVAREIAAKTCKKLRFPSATVDARGAKISDTASVVVEDTDLCPRYTARYVSGCTIAPSPAWLVDRLKAVGIRSINNVVDITNYVLIEYGHPLHAFDFDLLANHTVIVKKAMDGEVFQTLDGQQRVLKSSDLTIRDGEKVIALAGIMGGENSEISSKTTNILLESAYFNPSAIRLTSKRLGLHTESSHRFERGTDICILTKAIDRAASLIAELAGGVVAEGIIDTLEKDLPVEKILVHLERVNNLLGTKLTAAEVADYFQRLEILVEEIEPGRFAIEVPSFRVDLEREIDLIEEVARLHGFDNIPATMPKARVFSDRPTVHQKLETLVRDLMVTHGFNEVVNFSFVDPCCFDKILLNHEDSRRQSIRLLNPLVVEQSVMRTTLLPGLLETCVKNTSFRIMTQRIFELRRVYIPRAGQELPYEPLILACLLTGLRFPESWNQSATAIDFFDAKGVVENIFEQLGVCDVTYSNSHVEPYYHPGKACTIQIEGEAVGSLGEVHPTVQAHYGLDRALLYMELDFEKLVARSMHRFDISVPPKYPDTFRDVAMIVDEDIPASAIIACIKGLKLPEIENIHIFDVYKGANIPEGKISVAVRLNYRSLVRTLTDEEVSRLHAKVMDNLMKELKVSIR